MTTSANKFAGFIATQLLSQADQHMTNSQLEARFKNIFDPGADGALSIDISAIHEVEPAA